MTFELIFYTLGTYCSKTLSKHTETSPAFDLLYLTLYILDALRLDSCVTCFRLCHPGPCPTCNAYTSKHCNCSRSYQKVKCSQQVNVRCSQRCNKKLNCLKHTCRVVCHSGSCQPCKEVVKQGNSLLA